MATISRARYTEHLTRMEQTHPSWAKTFSEDERWSMVADDLTAGRSVAAVLISVVTLGLIAIVITVLAF